MQNRLIVSDDFIEEVGVAFDFFFYIVGGKEFFCREADCRGAKESDGVPFVLGRLFTVEAVKRRGGKVFCGEGGDVPLIETAG